MSDIIILNEDRNLNDENVYNENSSYLGGLLSKLNWFIVSRQSLKTKEKIMFFRLLSTMINSWISLSKSIYVLEKQEKSPTFKKLLWRFREELDSGKNLSYCLDLYPNSFLEAEVWMVRSWEKTWKLNTILNDLANQVEKVASISWKIKSALMYPMFIMMVVIWVISVMMIMVVPKLLDIFQDKSKLPNSTKTLMAVSDFFVNYWYILILVWLFLKVAIGMWKKTPTWKYMYDDFILKAPVFGQIAKKLILSKFSRVFAWLVWSWISVVESLNIISSVVWNEVYRQKILLLKEDVEKWIKIWESIDWDPLFPDMMVQMIQVWEETAKLDKTIVKVADFYEEQVDNIIATMNKLLEPFIIVFLAVVVWFIAIAIMQPIMSLSDTISWS